MLKRRLEAAARFVKNFFLLFKEFSAFFFVYSHKKISAYSSFFEKSKDNLVKLFTVKRGRYNRPFLHLSAMMVLFIGVALAPFLADTYPILASKADNNLQGLSSSQNQSVEIGDDVFQTDISVKPRDKDITYTVERGDTLSTIARKYGISVNTVEWANDLTGDDVSVGDTFKILPVSGIEYKVERGDTIYSIAKKLDTDPQKIVDFPFNDFANPETFALVSGQTLIVPDGIKPSEQLYIQPQVYAVQGPIAVSTMGFFWPVKGVITQFASWYHMALDIAAPYGTPIIAAESGKVTYVSLGTWDTGYGNNVWVDNGEGYATHYAHMITSNVSIGQTVVGGKTIIGWIGLTGRTTGPHVHFEIRRNGVLVNPLPYLQ